MLDSSVDVHSAWMVAFLLDLFFDFGAFNSSS